VRIAELHDSLTRRRVIEVSAGAQAVRGNPHESGTESADLNKRFGGACGEMRPGKREPKKNVGLTFQVPEYVAAVPLETVARDWPLNQFFEHVRPFSQLLNSRLSISISPAIRAAKSTLTLTTCLRSTGTVLITAIVYELSGIRTVRMADLVNIE
jgi:hypothetical protein